MSTEANIATMLQTKILPILLGKLVIEPTAYDRIPLAQSFDRVGQTNTVRVPRNINDYTVNQLPDGATTVQDVKSTDFIDIVAVREYVSEALSKGQLIKADNLFWLTTLSNMLESLYEETVTTGFQTIVDTVGINEEGADNVAVTRSVIQATKSGLTNARIPKRGRIMALGTTSHDDLASISDYQDAFSGNGNVEAENVPQIAGFEVIETEDALIPDGAAGKENLGF